MQCEGVTGTRVLNRCLKEANGYYESYLKNNNGKYAKSYYCHIHGRGLKMITKLSKTRKHHEAN